MSVECRNVLVNGVIRPKHSIIPNEDRQKLLDSFGRVGDVVVCPAHAIVTPKEIIRIYECVGDVRLVAYIAGVTIKAARQSVEGVMFPDDLLFPYSYVLEVSGMPKTRLLKARRMEYPDLKAEKIPTMTSKQAKNIIMRCSMLPGRRDKVKKEKKKANPYGF